MSEGKAKYKGILYKGREQFDGMVLITTYNENEAEGFEKKYIQMDIIYILNMLQKQN